MNVPAVYRSSEFRRLLLIGFSVITTIALSYDYVTAKGISDAFFVIIGSGLLLAVLVTVPVLLSDRGPGLD
ncbi:hypothetical protein [Haladaptatus sp. CMAA 1909]|uniref:hypothetical protein n=1 Tax=Haladaptatus sp. CMAA 1909 TaxID=3368986 RepID=UPI0037543C89